MNDRLKKLYKQADAEFFPLRDEVEELSSKLYYARMKLERMDKHNRLKELYAGMSQAEHGLDLIKDELEQIAQAIDGVD